MPFWHPSSSGFSGAPPGNTQQQALTASTQQPYPVTGVYSLPPAQVPTGLFLALHIVPLPSQYIDGGDWVLDTGETSHMANNPGMHSSSSPISS